MTLGKGQVRRTVGLMFVLVTLVSEGPAVGGQLQEGWEKKLKETPPPKTATILLSALKVAGISVTPAEGRRLGWSGNVPHVVHIRVSPDAMPGVQEIFVFAPTFGEALGLARDLRAGQVRALSVVVGPEGRRAEATALDY